MRKHRVVVKLWLAFIGLILVILIPLEIALNKLLVDFYATQVTDPLLYHSRQLAVLIGDNPEVIHAATSVGDMVGGEVIVLDSGGKPLPFPGASSALPPPAGVQQVMGGNVYVGQMEAGSGRSFVVTGVPIPNYGGAVLLLAPAEPLQRSLVLARRYLVLAGAGTLFIGTGLAFMLARQLLQPIIAIEEATRSIAQGNLATRVHVTARDEIGQLALAVNQMTVQLEDFEKRRREFLANVAHELRTPLSYIQGYTQALVEGLVERQEERERYQRVVQEEAIRLSHLVNDLMDMAQIDEGQMAFSFEVTDLHAPIEQATATVRPSAEKRGVEVVLSLADARPQVRADAGRIQQVMFNLLDNSLRHTPPGGQVTVEVARHEGHVRVSVCDTGPGIDPDLLPVVFERFHKQNSPGRGLGLSIVRSIVRAHGGEVGVHSARGQGATFWFALPLVRERTHLPEVLTR